MLQIMSVNFDNEIPQWRTNLETIPYNVLVVVRQGQVRYEINGSVVIAEAEDVLFIPRGARRSGENKDGIPHQKHTVYLHASPGLRREFRSWIKDISSSSGSPQASTPITAATGCTKRCGAGKATVPSSVLVYCRSSWA